MNYLLRVVQVFVRTPLGTCACVPVYACTDLPLQVMATLISSFAGAYKLHRDTTH